MLRDVAIIIANHNYGGYIARAIRSCLNQTVRERVKIILIDDCSTDNSAREILRFWGGVDVVIPLYRNVGLGSALNYALASVDCQYTCRVDSDDYINPSCIEVMWSYLNQHREQSVWGVSVDYFLEDLNGVRWKKMSAAIDPIGCGIMWRTDSLLKVGGWDHKLRKGEDVDLADRIKAAGGKIDNICLPLYNYIVHKDSLSHENHLNTGE